MITRLIKFTIKCLLHHLHNIRTTAHQMAIAEKMVMDMLVQVEYPLVLIHLAISL